MQSSFARAMGALLLSGGAAFFSVSAASAAEGTIDIELNRLQQVEGGCRLIVVFTNLLPVEIRSLEVETVLFDRDGRADRFLVLKSQPLAPRKIRVHQYDLSAARCEAIGSLLINDVVGCDGDGLTPALCLQRIAASSREKAKLFLSASEPRAAAEASPAE